MDLEGTTYERGLMTRFLLSLSCGSLISVVRCLRNPQQVFLQTFLVTEPSQVHP